MAALKAPFEPNEVPWVERLQTSMGPKVAEEESPASVVEQGLSSWPAEGRKEAEELQLQNSMKPLEQSTGQRGPGELSEQIPALSEVNPGPTCCASALVVVLPGPRATIAVVELLCCSGHSPMRHRQVP